MAKQMGVIPIVGTIGNITFYEMNGQYYARGKSSLSGKRVKTDWRFERTRMYSRRLGMASGAAGRIYRTLPVYVKDVTFYRRMVSAGLRLLKTGCTEQLLETELKAMFLSELIEKSTAARPVRKEAAAQEPVGQIIAETIQETVKDRDMVTQHTAEGKTQVPETTAEMPAVKELKGAVAPAAGAIRVNAEGKLEPGRREGSRPRETKTARDSIQMAGRKHPRKTARVFVPGAKNAHARTEKKRPSHLRRRPLCM